MKNSVLDRLFTISEAPSGGRASHTPALIHSYTYIPYVPNWKRLIHPIKRWLFRNNRYNAKRTHFAVLLSMKFICFETVNKSECRWDFPCFISKMSHFAGEVLSTRRYPINFSWPRTNLICLPRNSRSKLIIRFLFGKNVLFGAEKFFSIRMDLERGLLVQ